MPRRRATRRVVVIDGHPDPDPGRFVHALAGAYAAGARAAGHTVEYIRLAELEFPILRTNADFYGGTVPPSIQQAQQSIIQCDHVAMFYPLWLGHMPALLKGFLEQVFRRAVAYSTPHSHGGERNLLQGKSARIVVTMAMPARFFEQYFGAHGLTAMRRNVAGFLGIAPIRSQVIGRVERLSHAQRQALLEAMREFGHGAR